MGQFALISARFQLLSHPHLAKTGRNSRAATPNCRRNTTDSLANNKSERLASPALSAAAFCKREVVSHVNCCNVVSARIELQTARGPGTGNREAFKVC